MKGKLILAVRGLTEPKSQYNDFKLEFIPIIISETAQVKMHDHHLSYDGSYNKHYIQIATDYWTNPNYAKKILVLPENVSDSIIEDIKSGKLKNEDEIEL